MEDSDTGSIEANQQNKNISSLDGSFINAQQPSADDPLASVDLGPISQQEYEAQFFGFTPKSFSDGLYNATVDYLHDGILTMARKLAEVQFGGKSEQELLERAEAALQQVEPQIGKKFDKLEVYLAQNIFRIPSNVLLEEDSVHRQHPMASRADVEEAETENRRLIERIIASQYANACFRQELEDSEALVKELQDVVKKQELVLSMYNKSEECEEEMMSQDSDVVKH